MSDARRERRRRRKNLVLWTYGHACRACGETRPQFLTIDHVKDDGAAHRRRLGKQAGSNDVYLDIVRRGCPIDEFAILCSNCNLGDSATRADPFYILDEIVNAEHGDDVEPPDPIPTRVICFNG